MGQQNSSLKRIKELTSSATVIRHAAGEKVFVSHNNQKEYVLITKLFTAKQSEVQEIISKRKNIKGQFISELLQCGKENENYCTNVEYMHLLFKRPSKSLLQEINNRRAVDQWFNQGEVMMVAYCALEGLKLLSEMNYDYDINVDETTLFISNDGVIVLSDTEQYTDRIGNKNYLSHRVIDIKGRNRESYNLYQLGIVLDHLEKGSKTSYSFGLKQFIGYLIKGEIQNYNSGLQHLYRLKKTSRNAQQKDAMISLISLCSKSNKQSSLCSKSNKQSESKSENTSNDLPCNKNLKKRNPLGEIKLNCNTVRENGKQMNKLRNTEENHPQRKENSYITYKSQFQAGVLETLTQDNRIFQEGQTLRLDQLSSIVGGLSKQLDDEQQQSTFLLQDIDKPQKNIPSQSNPNPSNNFLQTPMIDLFSPSRPQRLKQLVLNQKGIIYEQSGDEMQSLASQRTFRHRNNLQ